MQVAERSQLLQFDPSIGPHGAFLIREAEDLSTGMADLEISSPNREGQFDKWCSATLQMQGDLAIHGC